MSISPFGLSKFFLKYPIMNLVESGVASPPEEADVVFGTMCSVTAQALLTMFAEYALNGETVNPADYQLHEEAREGQKVGGFVRSHSSRLRSK